MYSISFSLLYTVYFYLKNLYPTFSVYAFKHDKVHYKTKKARFMKKTIQSSDLPQDIHRVGLSLDLLEFSPHLRPPYNQRRERHPANDKRQDNQSEDTRHLTLILHDDRVLTL